MMKLRIFKYIFMVLLITAALLPASAQNVKFIAEVTKTQVAVGEPFQLTYTLNTSGTGFQAPSFKNFDYTGPGIQRKRSNINGKFSQSVSYVYVIAATKEGSITIDPTSIYVNGKKVQSNKINVKVKGVYNAQTQSVKPNQQASRPGKNAEDNLFVRTIVSKKKVYMGEQITVTQKIYTKLNLKGVQDIQLPSYTGFWVQDAPQQHQMMLTTENMDGEVYNVTVLRKSFLFPQRSGKLEIPPITVECIVREHYESDDEWSDPWVNTYRDVVYTIKSKPVVIEVMPLPEKGKPKNFTGAVGDYSFNATIDRSRLKANEALTLDMEITGIGNIKLIEPPKINLPDTIEQYSPKVNDNTQVTDDGVSGSKKMSFLLIPRSPGDYELGAVSFSYFDPNKGEYVTLHSPEFNIRVDKGDQQSFSATNNFVSKQGVQVIPSDIRYIKTGSVVFTPQEKRFFGSPLFIAGLAAPLLGFFAFLFFRKKRIEQNSDTAQVKSRQATKMAKARLIAAEKHMKENNKESFYEEIFKALYGYLGYKLDIPVAELSKDAVSGALAARGCSAATVSRLLATLDTCEFARYAPSAAPADLNTAYSDAVEVITTLEDEVK